MMEGFDFPIEILRTPRTRSAAIQVNGSGVVIRVPKSLSDKRIRELILKRSQWIKTKLREHSERPAIAPREYVSGEGFPYLGKTYRLKVVQGAEQSLKLQAGRLVATITSRDNQTSDVKNLLIDWYQRHADLRLREKVERLAPIVGVKPSSIVVKGYKSRWGSCSSKGDISFNWRIIAAPHRIVDYVVIHELCHMLEHNHSPKFWRHVERHEPDWRWCRQWLKTQPALNPHDI